MKVIIQNTLHDQDIPADAVIKKIINAASSALQNDATKNEVVVRLVSLDEIQELNKTYRHKDYPTNVLSFPFHAPHGLEVSHLGDIIICHHVLKTEALAQHKTLLDHYTHMLIHGFLHLLGYDHVQEKDALEMEGLEIKLLQQLNIDNPYEETP